MKELAFFGAFNPPTKAHTTLAKVAMDQTGAEQVIFIPSKAKYIRSEQRKQSAYSDQKRLDMLIKIGKNNPWMTVSDIDLAGEEQPKSYETLTKLREAGYNPALMIGSDKLYELPSWYRIEDIGKEFGIVCLVRGNREMIEEALKSDALKPIAQYITLIETPGKTRFVSSTMVRAMTMSVNRILKDIAEVVPEEIVPFLFESLPAQER